VVLNFPDAETTFGLAMNSLWGLEFAGCVPPMLVVGIGYPVESVAEIFTLGSRDPTPTVDPRVVERFNWDAGGAANFLEFIRTELKPWVGAQFGVDPDDNAYFGYSYDGLFGSYVLMTLPHTFQRYGLGSPSLWYDTEFMFTLEEELSRQRDLNAKVYFTVGEYEGPRGDQLHLAWRPETERAAELAAHADYPDVDMVRDMERFVAALRSRGYPGLAIESEVIAREFHLTGGPMTLCRTLRFLFGAPG
jgi:predicted alpha/beta superfamily hydrolase